MCLCVFVFFFFFFFFFSPIPLKKRNKTIALVSSRVWRRSNEKLFSRWWIGGKKRPIGWQTDESSNLFFSLLCLRRRRYKKNQSFVRSRRKDMHHVSQLPISKSIHSHDSICTDVSSIRFRLSDLDFTFRNDAFSADCKDSSTYSTGFGFASLTGKWFSIAHPRQCRISSE